MKTKFYGILLIATILLAAIAIAVSFDVTTPATFSQAVDNVTFEVINNEVTSIPIAVSSIITLAGEDTSQLFSITGPTSIAGSDSETYTITPVGGDVVYSNFKFGKTYTSDFTVSSGSNTTTRTFSLERSFCSFGEKSGDLEINSFKINNVEGFGQEDDEWYPLDEIEVEVKVKNNGADNIDDVIVEYCLYDSDNDECVLDNEEDIGKVKDGDKKTVTINFQLDPDDLDVDVGNYLFLVKVYSDDLGEDELCLEDSESADVLRDDPFVILDNIQMPETAECGSELDVTADIWNIGDDDEDDVYVTMTNSQLGISEIITVGDIDELDNDRIDARLTIPEDASAGRYNILFRVFDADDDIFENQDGDEAEFTRSLEITCISQPKGDASISAVLETDAEDVKAGKDVVIKATVTNTGEDRTAYTIGVSGNELFSTVKEISPSTLTLNAGESRDVLITLSLHGDSEGEQPFTIKAIFENTEVEQQVSLSVGKSGFSLTGSAIGESFGDNWFIWVIVLINIILIVAIIIVAVKVARA